MKMALGRNLRDMLFRISKAAGLSRRYTNHCLRATTHFEGAGINDQAICSVTGHKCDQSLDSYNKPGEKERRVMAKVWMMR